MVWDFGKDKNDKKGDFFRSSGFFFVKSWNSGCFRCFLVIGGVGIVESSPLGLRVGVFFSGEGDDDALTGGGGGGADADGVEGAEDFLRAVCGVAPEGEWGEAGLTAFAEVSFVDEAAALVAGGAECLEACGFDLGLVVGGFVF